MIDTKIEIRNQLLEYFNASARKQLPVSFRRRGADNRTHSSKRRFACERYWNRSDRECSKHFFDTDNVWNLAPATVLAVNGDYKDHLIKHPNGRTLCPMATAPSVKPDSHLPEHALDIRKLGPWDFHPCKQVAQFYQRMKRQCLLKGLPCAKTNSPMRIHVSLPAGSVQDRCHQLHFLSPLLEPWLSCEPVPCEADCPSPWISQSGRSFQSRSRKISIEEHGLQDDFLTSFNRRKSSLCQPVISNSSRNNLGP